ncbi:MAG: phenylalanine--tRNA ligase subunit beta, partial [Plesiomonas shigelloides]
IGAAVYNQNRQQPRVRIFESGLRFVPDAAAENGVRQEVMLAGLLTGNRSTEHWGQESKTVDFFDMKGDLEAVLELTGRLDDVKFEACSNPALHPGQSAALVLDGEQIGFIGALHPELERKLDLNGRTMLFEVLWDKISQRTITSAQSISRFPANRRDIAIVVNESVSAQNIIDECRKVGGNQLVGVNLFDVYRGKGVNDGCKSLAISLTLQDTSRTLEEEEIANAVSGIVEALKVRFQASLRD